MQPRVGNPRMGTPCWLRDLGQGAPVNLLSTYCAWLLVDLRILFILLGFYFGWGSFGVGSGQRLATSFPCPGTACYKCIIGYGRR